MFCTQYVSFLHVTYGVLVQRSRASRAGGRISMPKKTKPIISGAADCQSCLMKASRIAELEARVSRLSSGITRLSQVRGINVEAGFA